MKKLFFAVVMMLLSITANAQSISGTWTLDKEYAAAINAIAATQEGKLQMELGMGFTDTEVKFLTWCTIEMEGIKMKMDFWVPGTYTKSNNKVVCTYNKEKADFQITDIDSDNEEFGAMLKEPGTKAMMLAMLKGEAKKEIAPQLASFAELADEFDNFTVMNVDESALIIDNDGVEVIFTKK